MPSGSDPDGPVAPFCAVGDGVDRPETDSESLLRPVLSPAPSIRGRRVDAGFDTVGASRDRCFNSRGGGRCGGVMCHHRRYLGHRGLRAAVAVLLLGCTPVRVVSGEQCRNGIDDDFDGRTDCSDSDCAREWSCKVESTYDPELPRSCRNWASDFSTVPESFDRSAAAMLSDFEGDFEGEFAWLDDAQEVRGGGRDTSARAVEHFERRFGEDLRVATGYFHAVPDHVDQLVAVFRAQTLGEITRSRSGF